jgi:hypothetical protein
MPAFISHSQKDEAIYSALCMALDAAEIVRWDPLKMSPGRSLADQLQQAIQRCEVCIFIATRRSIESTWCLAELGAFWGAGKRVLIFLADPDLTEAVLPPQFKGNLRVENAGKLVDATREAIASHSVTNSLAYDFFRTSGSYGSDADWTSLIEGTFEQFDILGVTLRSWRDMNNSEEIFLRKAEQNCRIRILLMDKDNDLLKGLLLGRKPIRSVQNDIDESLSYYTDLAKKNPNISVRQVRKGMPHFFLTKTDLSAVIILYTSSLDWGNGPTWRCHAKTDLYNVAAKEFDYLWEVGTNPA